MKLTRKLRKKSCLFAFIFLLLCFANMGRAQNVYIPDANFKTALLNHNPVINANHDGEIQVIEAQIFSSTIDVSFKNITNLTGIAAFFSIKGLNCSFNQLTSLNLNVNTALTNLNCESNALSSLNLSSNTALTSLICGYNNLSSLNLTANTSLAFLECTGNQQFTTLDLSTNTALIYLYCENNQLTTLDLSTNTALTFLECRNNQLTSLNLSANPLLTSLSCYNNQLTSLDLSSNSALTQLYCYDNQLTSLDLRANTSLTNLKCQNNQLTSLDLRNGHNSAISNYYYNSTGNPNLTCISVDNPVWSASTWTYRDPQTQFSSDCNCIPTSSGISQTACSTYTAPDGQVYTSSGTYTAIIPNAQGCDSTITINLTVKTTPVITGTTGAELINSGSVSLSATASAGIVKWYAFQNGGSLLATGNTFNTPVLSTSKTYYVTSTANGCTNLTRSPVVATIYKAELDANSCGMTMANASVPVTALAVPGATNYRFKVENTNLAYLANFYSVVPQLQTNWTNNLQAGQTYTVRVAVMKNGVWSSFGTVCNVTTAPASPVSMLKATYCNSTVSTLNQPVYCVSVPGATNYRYKIENTGLAYSRVYTTGSADSLFRMNVFSDILYATTYTIRVGYYSNGTWSAFGPSCTLTTPAEPKLINTDCGIVLSLMSQDIHAIVEPGATNYKFKVENTGLTFSHVIQSGSSNNTFKMSNVPGIVTNTNYTVKVAYYKNGLWSPFGSACTVTSAANPAIYHSGGAIGAENGTSNVLEEIYLEAFPNPNHGEFTLNASHEGIYSISNELGQVIQQIALNAENNYRAEFQNLENGVYFVSATIENESGSYRIMRKVLVIK